MFIMTQKWHKNYDIKITWKVTNNLITYTGVTKTFDQVNVSFLSLIKFA